MEPMSGCVEQYLKRAEAIERFNQEKVSYIQDPEPDGVSQRRRYASIQYKSLAYYIKPPSSSSFHTHPPQQDYCVSTLHTSSNLLPKLQQPPAFDMKNPQSLFLPATPVIQILHLQSLRRYIQHSSHTPLLVEPKFSTGQLTSCGVRFSFDMEVYPFLHGHFLVAFCGSFECVQRDYTAGCC